MLNELEPDPPLSEAEEELVRSLSADTIAMIDAVLISEVSTRWRKVAMVVARTMEALEHRLPPITDIFFARRVRYLVKSNELQSQGDLSRMRYSEIRLVQV